MLFRTSEGATAGVASPTPRTPECSERLCSPCTDSPALMSIDLELDRALARLDDFNIEASDVGCGNYRRRSSSTANSPSTNSKLSALFQRKSWSKLRGEEKEKDHLKLEKFQASKANAMLNEAMTIVRARPRAVLKSPTPKSPALLRKPKLSMRGRSDPSQGQTVGVEAPTSTLTEIQFCPKDSELRTPVRRSFHLGNFLEISRVSTSVDIDGSPVARSQQRNFSLVSAKRSTKSTPGKRRGPSEESVMEMMKSLKTQMPIHDNDNDDDKSDSSTIHLLKIDDHHDEFICENNSHERSSDSCLPPTLTILTSRMTTTSILGASAQSGFDDDFLLEEKALPAPVMRETKSCSSVHTLEWTSYNKYYESPRSPTQLRETTSNSSQTAGSNGTGQISGTFLAPPLETKVSACGSVVAPAPSIEVAPGHSVSIRGADETLLYVAADTTTASKSLITTNQCMTCTSTVHCVWDAEFILCPVCLTVQPVGTSTEETQRWGVGLGFLPHDWDVWKESLAQNQSPSP